MVTIFATYHSLSNQGPRENKKGISLLPRVWIQLESSYSRWTFLGRSLELYVNCITWFVDEGGMEVIYLHKHRSS